ncbi:histidine-type phosphatase [Shigella flexneri]
MLSLHNAQFYLLQRTPEVARSPRHPVIRFDQTALTPHPPQKQAYGVTLPTSVLFIAGHDTNLANLGGALELNWTLPGQPDNTPPGGELVFERWRRLAITASGFRFRWSSRLYSRCVIKRRCH